MMDSANPIELQEEMTKILEAYKNLKDKSHSTASCSLENNEEAMRLLKQKNDLERQMPQDKAFIRVQQAYIDAELCQSPIEQTKNK